MKIPSSIDQKSKIQAIILILFIVVGLFLSVTVLLPNAEKNRLNDDANKIFKPKISSEDENIDSFNINPKGGRWNVSLDDTTEDTIIDSNLKLTTVNNDTSGSNGYSMNRATSKTDTKINYRLKTDSGSNYTEFSRDTIGNSWDFAENNDNWISLSGSTVLAENGILTVSRTSADSYWGITLNIDLELPTIIYNTVEIKAKGETVPLLVFQFVHKNGSTTQAVITGDLSNDWEIFTLDLTDISPNIWKNFGLVKTLNIYSTDPNSFLRSFSLEYIKLIGDLDFATYTDNTWDFDNSDEYFYDELDDISDFDDATEENWASISAGTSVSNVDGHLEVTTDTSDTLGIGRDSIGVVASIYKWFTMEYEIETATSIDYIQIFDEDANLVFEDLTDRATGHHQLSTDLSLDADWTATEQEIWVFWYFLSSGTNTINLNFTFIYDVELGDIENWAGADFYVHPKGYLTVFGAGGTPLIANVQTGDIIDSSLFTHLKLKIRGLGTGISGYIKSRTGAVQKTISPVFDLNSTWNELIIDLTLDSDWTDNNLHDLVGLAFTGAGEGEYIQIGYWLLLGHYDDSESSIGLIDPIDDTSLVNITSYYFNSVNTYPLQYKIELYDNNQEIAYYYYENFTGLNNEYVRGRFDYNTLESEFKFQLYSDNDTRLINIQFPLDFEIGTGAIPVLFDTIGFPRIIVSTYVPVTSYYMLYLDYITAPFSERRWLQTETATDPQWTIDTWSGGYTEGDITAGQLSKYELIIPKMDSVSVDLFVNFNDSSTLDSYDLFHIFFSIKSVNPIDGSTDDLLNAQFFVGRCDVCPNYYPKISFDTESDELDAFGIYGNTFTGTPKFSITASLDSNRELLTAKGRLIPDSNNKSNIIDVIGTTDISEHVGYDTSEFLLEVEYGVFNQVLSVDAVTYGMENFDFISRDIFADLLKPITDPIAESSKGLFDWLGSIFRSVGNMLATAFRGSIDWLLNGITGLVTIITNGLTSLGNTITGALTSLGSTITGALTTLSNAITGILNSIVTELQGLAAAIISGIDSAFTTIINGLEDALDTLLSAIDDVLDDISGFIQQLIDDVVALADQIWQGFIDVVGDVVDAIITWLLSVISDIVDLLIAVVDWIIDTMGLRDLINALLGLIATTFDGLVYALTIIYDALIYLINSLKISMYIIVAVIFIYIVIIPLKTGLDIFDAIDRMLEKAFINLMGDTQILGFTIPAYLGFIEFGLIIALLTAEGVIV